VSVGLRDELVAMDAHDQTVRAELAADGSLFDGYDPRMAAVHEANASRLRAVMDDVGWPGEPLVGSDGAAAAWRVAQHAIGEPDFQRRCLRALQEAATRGDVPAWQPAMLEDRIRMFEGRPQRYGTQLEPDVEGRLRSYAIEDPEHVDDRRRAVGLEPLAACLARADPVPLPTDRARFEREYDAWLRRVGWRT
jgi:hypothetical protein